MATTLTDRLSGITSDAAVKVPCIAVATSNITLNGLQTVDTVALTQGKRVLVTGQTDQTANGIYVADSGNWVRAADFDGSYDIVHGTLISVVSGTYAGTFWSVSTADPIIIGTSNITITNLNIYSVSSATSTTSNAIGTGSKTFTVPSNPLYQVGQFILIVDAANSANYMHGQITAYSGASLTVNVLDIGGSGTKTSWTIFLSSPVGTTGATGPTPNFSGTSTTSQTPTTGAMTFTTQSGLAYSAGQFLSVISNAAPSAYMIGNVTSYSGTSLVMNMVTSGGTGTHTDWNISLSGNPVAPAAGKVLAYQVTDVTDITLSAAPTQANIGSTKSITIPTKGMIHIYFTGQLIFSTNENDLVLGIRIGATNYWPVDSTNTNYFGAYEVSSLLTVTPKGWGYAGFNEGGGSFMTGIDITASGIPTGAQTVQVIAAKTLANGLVIKGTIATSIINILTVDCS